MKKYCVYKHTNKTDGKVYIGITGQSPEERWRHGKGYKSNIHFHNAIIKYGWDGFDHEIIADNLSLDGAKDLEIYYICLYGSDRKELGYNRDLGGDIKADYTEEALDRMRQAQLRRFQNVEEIRKISESHKRYYKENPMTEEQKKKDSEALKRHYANHPVTDAGRKQRSETMKSWYAQHPDAAQKRNQPNAKPVAQYDGNILVKIWPSIASARRAGFKYVFDCCNGRQKSCGGFYWKFAQGGDAER